MTAGHHAVHDVNILETSSLVKRALSRSLPATDSEHPTHCTEHYNECADQCTGPHQEDMTSHTWAYVTL